MTVINTGWLNENANRRFPLADDVSAKSTTGWELPNAVITDLTVVATVGVHDPNNFYVSKVALDGEVLIVTIGYKSGVVTTDVAQAVVDTLYHEDNASYELKPLTTDGVSGRISIGFSSVFSILTPGVESFVFANTRIVVSCIRPSAGAVTSIGVDAGSVTGAVKFVAGSGVKMTLDSLDNSIKIEIDTSTIDLSACGCSDASSPLYSINGVTPDSNGNVNIRGASCLVLKRVGNDLQIFDTCSQPCCDCEGVDNIATKLEAIIPKIEEMNNYIETIRSRLENAAAFLGV